MLTHWGRVTHICVSKLTIIGSDNGLSPDRRQAIIWTNAGLLLIGPLGTNFSEILIEILTFSFKKMRLKVSSAKRRPFCLGLNVLRLGYNYVCRLPSTKWCHPQAQHWLQIQIVIQISSAIDFLKYTTVDQIIFSKCQTTSPCNITNSKCETSMTWGINIRSWSCGIYVHLCGNSGT